MSEVSFGQFDGINNVLPEQRLGPADLVAAVNVDLDEVKRLSRRAGTTTVNAGSSHSRWSDQDLCLFRRGSGLYRMATDHSAVLLTSAFTGSNPCAYLRVASGVYFSDGITKGWTDGYTVQPWGIDPPTVQPVAASGSGSAPPGTYLYALTFLREDGEESSTIEAGEIAASGGINFTAIEVSSDPSVVSKAIYVSSPGGTALYRALEIPNAQNTATWNGSTAGKELDSMLEIPLPASNVLALDHGRICAGFRSFLLYTPIYKFERYRPDEHFIAFPSQVRMIVKAEGGRYVLTDSGIFWLEGQDIARASITKKADYGSPAGAPAVVDGDLVGKGIPGIVSIVPTTQGFVALLPQGQIANLTIKRYWPPAAKWVSSAYVREAGKNRALFFFMS